MADAYMSDKWSEEYNRLVLLQSRLHMLTEVFEGEDFDQDSFISEWITQLEDMESKEIPSTQEVIASYYDYLSNHVAENGLNL